MPSSARAVAVAALGIATFSCMDALMKRLSIAIGAYDAMLWRSLAGAAVSGAWFVAWGYRWPDRSMLAVHIRRSVAAGTSVFLFFWGLVRVPMAEGVALTFLAPVIAILLAAPLCGEPVRARALAACAVALPGVAVIAAGRIGQGGGHDALAGMGAILLASILYAYSLVQLRLSATRAGPVEIVFLSNLVMAAMFLPAAPVMGHVPAAGLIPWILAATALALVSGALLAWAYAHAEAQRIAPVEYTAFIWAALFGALMFGERLLPWTIAGAALIVGGCLLVARDRPGEEAAL